MSFWIRDLPTAMRNNGWMVGAAYMERWFRTPGREMSRDEKTGRTDYRTLPASLLELHLVKMSWAMRFDRVSSTAYRLQREWVTESSAVVLRQRIAAWRRDHGTTKLEFRFGDLSRPTVIVNETCQANSRPVGGRIDPLDNLYAALGRATLHLAVEGSYRATANGKATLTVDGLGVYLRDSYDFTGSQPLGSWNRRGVARVAVNTLDIPVQSPSADNDADWSVGIGRFAVYQPRYFDVSNDSFQAYRANTKHGGDFTIFTDVHRLQIPQGTMEINL